MFFRTSSFLQICFCIPFASFISDGTRILMVLAVLFLRLPTWPWPQFSLECCLEVESHQIRPLADCFLNIFPNRQLNLENISVFMCVYALIGSFCCDDLFLAQSIRFLVLFLIESQAVSCQETRSFSSKHRFEMVSTSFRGHWSVLFLNFWTFLKLNCPLSLRTSLSEKSRAHISFRRSILAQAVRLRSS